MLKSIEDRFKTIAVYMLLGCLGIIAALILIELFLHILPQHQLDAIIERSSQRLQLYRLDPRIGWSFQPGAESIITTQENEAIPVKVNALGLRDREHTYEKPPGAYRLLIVGDSFAEGQEVKSNEAFSHQLEVCLNQRLSQSIEVINGGVSGYSTADEYLFYKHEGIKYSPDLVLLAFYVGNDFWGLDRSTLGERLVSGFGGYRFRLDQGRLEQAWVSWEYPPDRQKISTIELLLRRYSRLYRFLAHPESKIYSKYSDAVAKLQTWFQQEQAEAETTYSLRWDLYMHVENFPENSLAPQKLREIWRVFQAIVGQLKAEVQANDSQLAAIIIPADYQVRQETLIEAVKKYPILYNETFNAQWRIDEPNSTIVREMERQAIPVLDLLPYFQAHAAANGHLLYFPGVDEHLNRDGHKLAADMICDWLIRNQAIRLPRS